MWDPRWDQIFIPGGKGGIPPFPPGILGGIAGIPPTSNFSLEYHKNKGNDLYLKRLKVVTQIHLVSTLGNVKTTLWSIYIYTE